MKSQDDKEQHQITCEGFLDAGILLAGFACGCGRMWLQQAVDAPHSSSLIKCECGARAWFDMRTGDQKLTDDGGAP